MRKAEYHGYSEDWEKDCQKYHGRVLTGNYAHYCYDWDSLPIDESLPEWETCICYDPRLNKKSYKTFNTKTETKDNN